MYYILILLFVFLYVKLSSQPLGVKLKKENTYAFIICAVLVLMAAFRSDTVGADTGGYRLDYEDLGKFQSMQDLIDRYSVYYIGYFGLSKIFYMVGMPVYVWFGFVEAIYIYALMLLVNRFSKDKIFSLLVFTTIGLYSFSMAGLKQTLAMSMMLMAFIAFMDKKYWYTALLLFLTYYTHQSALIMLVAFPLYFVKRVKLLIPASLIMVVLIYAYSFSFMTAMVDILENEKWETYLVTDSGYTSVTLIFYSVITLIAGLNIKSYNQADPVYARFFLALSIIGCGLQFLASTSPSLFRLAYLYTPFMMILLPNAAYYSKNEPVVRMVLMVCIIFYFLYTNRHWPYSFIWNQ